MDFLLAVVGPVFLARTATGPDGYGADGGYCGGGGDDCFVGCGCCDGGYGGNGGGLVVMLVVGRDGTYMQKYNILHDQGLNQNKIP